jgi:aspartate-semialdehyde dehydrogenase
MDVPLLLSEKALAPFQGRVVTLAQPATQALAAAIAPIQATVGVSALQVTALFGAAHAGEQGLKAFERQTAALLNAGDVEPTVFPHRLAFNVVPQVGGFVQANTIDELALKVEAARALGPIPLACTLAWAPFFHGTALFVTAQLDRALEADAARGMLKAQAGVKLLDDPAQGIYPMPMLVTADPAIHLGRVRTEGKTLQLCAALDNAGRAGDAAASLALALAARG